MLGSSPWLPHLVRLGGVGWLLEGEQVQARQEALGDTGLQGGHKDRSGPPPAHGAGDLLPAAAGLLCGDRRVRDMGPGPPRGGWGVRDAGPGAAVGRTGALSLLRTGSPVCWENRLLNENETVVGCGSSRPNCHPHSDGTYKPGKQLGVTDPHKRKVFIFSEN